MRVVPVSVAAHKKVTHTPQYNESIFNNLEWKGSVPELLKNQPVNPYTKTMFMYLHEICSIDKMTVMLNAYGFRHTACTTGKVKHSCFHQIVNHNRLKAALI